MVHVVLAGGSGNVGWEITQELFNQGKHQVTVFSRNGAPELTAAGIDVVKVNYLDKAELTAALKGVHTVLSFLVGDQQNLAQNNLVAACVDAGVKRFAPSEWATRCDSHFPGYAYKDELHAHLKELNAEKPVLEYCLFQCGVFMNYLAYPKVTTEHLFITCIGYDCEGGHAIMVEEGEDWRVWTTIQDVAKVVAAAIDYEGKWPEVGGIVGSRIQEKELVKLIEKYAGRPMTIHRVQKADLAKGELNSDWIPPMNHPHMPPEMKTPEFKRMVLSSYALVASNGAVDVPPTWNKLLPDMKLTDVETFLRDALGEKEKI
ncbi:MAG: hypothetical protein M1834_005494 [Cirrosporium novae-zelandiae]|nr:MAG: hypothetical protein M1834_005494 [Cirrosporium novae-zelandiae]